jgi:glycosyltransferase involved in cell wall biosynthesis
MKILHVVGAYYPFQEKGGPVYKVRALASRLAARGHQVTVLTPDLGLRQYPEVRSRLQKNGLGWRLELDGAEILYLPTVAHYRALTLNPGLWRFSKRRVPQFDVVHFYGLYDLMGPEVSRFCRRDGIPYIVEPMGMYRPIDRNFRLKALWHRLFGASFLQNAAKMIATSELERQELLAAGVSPARVVVRYNGVDSRRSPASVPGAFRAKWGIPRDEPLILFLSRLIPRKGADLLIEAFAKVCGDAGRLVIAGPEGESGYRAFLQKRADDTSATGRIIFCGSLYDDEKEAALQDADVFVLPSRYENFANVAAEAMAFGVPVIVSDACGIGALVEGQAGLVIPATSEALTEALRTMLGDKAAHAAFQEGCRRVARQLNWDCLTAQMETHYAAAAGAAAGKQ